MIIAPELEYIAYNNKSLLRGLSPLTKFFLTMLYLFLNLFLKGYFFICFFFYVIFLLLISRVEWKYVSKPLFLASGTSIVLFIAKLHFLKKGAPFFVFILDFYPESFFDAMTTSLRIVSGVLLIIIFIGTTTIKEFLSVLRKLKVPMIFVEIFLIIFKYIFILNDEGLKMKNAQTVRLGYSGFRRALESLGTLFGMIVLRGLNKGTSMSEALFVRGYNGQLFYPIDVPGPKVSEYFVMLIFGLIPLLVSLFIYV